MTVSATAARAVVFAYHNVGVRCLRVLLARGLEIPLVVTHGDDDAEGAWFRSVAATASECGIPWITPPDPNTDDVVARVAETKPDFLFSFYYRRMLGASLLAMPRRGALNMHGSLLPHYRGRAPVNWAVLEGAHETGATLHYMVDKPDAGDIVDQTAVPILPDDTAQDVYDKVTVAAEITLDRALPALIAGTAPRRAQDLSLGRYYGGRRPEDGIIDWSRDARTIHNLVRAVAPPYPGAFTTIGGVEARVLKTRRHDSTTKPTGYPTLSLDDGRVLAHCGGGGTLEVLALELGGVMSAPSTLRERFGTASIPLESSPVAASTRR